MVENKPKPVEEEGEEDNEGIIPLTRDLVGKTVEITTARRTWTGKVVKYDKQYQILVIKNQGGLYTIRLKNIISFGILK